MKILLVDHISNDCALLKRLIPNHEIKALPAISESTPLKGIDLIILNIDGKQSNGLLYTLDLPIILVGDRPDDDPLVIQSIAKGAQDYLNRKSWDRQLLEKSISFSCKRYQIQKNLRDLSLTDSLTGLYNRRGFDQLLEKQISYAVRHGQPFLLISIDINAFKSINDKFGHPVGDQALKDIAEALLSSFRKHDLVARVGGDEFAVIAPNTTASEPLIEHLLLALLSFSERPYTLAVSVGECLFDPRNPMDAKALIAEADFKLYCRKNNEKF